MVNYLYSQGDETLNVFSDVGECLTFNVSHPDFYEILSLVKEPSTSVSTLKQFLVKEIDILFTYKGNTLTVKRNSEENAITLNNKYLGTIPNTVYNFYKEYSDSTIRNAFSKILIRYLNNEGIIEDLNTKCFNERGETCDYIYYNPVNTTANDLYNSIRTKTGYILSENREELSLSEDFISIKNFLCSFWKRELEDVENISLKKMSSIYSIQLKYQTKLSEYIEDNEISCYKDNGFLSSIKYMTSPLKTTLYLRTLKAVEQINSALN